ncbi:PfkB family carbohydrate kinase [Nitratireductor sp. StC3]|uniref:PfkB family carbohydrate kinase n=1 Tax=Nitratireductor sp. StC3 TaxID=2126741 RepID=UPI000D0D6FC3|nr:PfkB family carbohydrate kinase [Nitratireductor sp. StC3]PSM19660.1 carbohydrate kinase [Nitratireductor sp. StC3]
MPSASRTILAVGGAHIDRRGRVAGPFVPGASNPGTMREEVGGGVFNAARVMAGRGARVALMSARGGDAAGEAVAAAIAAAGIADLSAVYLDRTTASYTAILDADGDVVAALADMALYDAAFDRQLRRSGARAAVADADAVLCDANLSTAALDRLAGLAGASPLYAIAISPAKVGRLAPVADRLAGLFMNRREAAALTATAATAPPQALVAALRTAGLARAVVTAGGGELIAFDDEAFYRLTPPPPRRIADVTGAGDALAGTMVESLTAKIPFAEALRRGVAAAVLCLESAAAIADHDDQTFAQTLARVPAPAFLPLPQDRTVCP